MSDKQGGQNPPPPPPPPVEPGRPDPLLGGSTDTRDYPPDGTKSDD